MPSWLLGPIYSYETESNAETRRGREGECRTQIWSEELSHGLISYDI